MMGVHIDYYSQNETGMRKNIRDQCIHQLTAIRGLNIPGGEKHVCPNVTDYLFLLNSVEEKSDKYDLYYRTFIIGGAFIHHGGVEIIMHPSHMDKEDQLLDELDKIFMINRANRANRHVKVRTDMN